MRRLHRRSAVGLIALLALVGVLVLPALAAEIRTVAPRAVAPGSTAVPASVAPSSGAASVGPAAGERAPGAGSPDADGGRRPRPVLGLEEANERDPIVRGVPGLLDGVVDRTSIALTATYDVTAHLDFGTRAFDVTTRMIVRNDSGGPIDRIELNTIAARLGAMTLGDVRVAGAPVAATVDDQTISVPLGGILGKGHTVEVEVGYRATLRSNLTGSNWLFTRTNGIANAHRWIPWISRPVAFDRPNHGDPFVTPVSPRVTVTISADRPLTFATTGEQVHQTNRTRYFEATNVRDFVFAAAPDYATVSGQVGDTTIRVHYRPGFPATAALAAARRAIEEMEPLLGDYPYPTYDIAQTAGGFGMEAPGLTWIPTGVGSGNLAYLVTHETAHQWFYGIVGSDQAEEPFTDEAITDFVARYVLGSRRASSCSTARLDLSIYRYSSACYYEIVYIQGGNFLDDLRRQIGPTAFWAGVRDYLAENRFGIAGTKTLLETIDDATSQELDPTFRPRFPRLY